MSQWDKLFRKWDIPTDEYEKRYKYFLNKVDQMMREAKRDYNLRKLEQNSAARTVYKTFGCQNKQQLCTTQLDIEQLKIDFTSVGRI